MQLKRKGNLMLKNKKILIMSLLASAIALSACQPQQASKKEESVQTQEQDKSLQLIGEIQKLSLNLPKCQDNNCPGLSIERLKSNQPFVDEMIDQHILKILHQTLMSDDSEASTVIITDQAISEANSDKVLTAEQKLEQQVIPYSQSFFKLDQEVKALSANHKISLMIKPKILNSEGALVTVVLNSSDYLGGAHGSASQQYFNFDLTQKKLVSLDEIVEKNQLAVLKAKAHDAFKAWVIDSELSQNPEEYEQMWKFKLKDNYYLGQKGLILQYEEYEIGPYVVGLPRLMIPYEELKGVLKPQYLPEGIVETKTTNTKEK